MSNAHLQKAKPREVMTPHMFLEQYGEVIKRIEDDVEVDCSFKDGKRTIVLHDMRNPSSIRRGVLYTEEELRDRVYEIVGDIDRRIKKFMAAY